MNVAVEAGTFEQLVGVPLSPETCHVFLCGNPAMIDEMTGVLVDRGFTPKDREHPDGERAFSRSTGDTPPCKGASHNPCGVA